MNNIFYFFFSVLFVVFLLFVYCIIKSIKSLTKVLQDGVKYYSKNLEQKEELTKQKGIDLREVEDIKKIIRDNFTQLHNDIDRLKETIEEIRADQQKENSRDIRTPMVHSDRNENACLEDYNRILKIEDKEERKRKVLEFKEKYAPIIVRINFETASYSSEGKLIIEKYDQGKGYIIEFGDRCFYYPDLDYYTEMDGDNKYVTRLYNIRSIGWGLLESVLEPAICEKLEEGKWVLSKKGICTLKSTVRPL